MKTLAQALAETDLNTYPPAFQTAIAFILPHETEFVAGHHGDWDYVRTENVPGDSGGLTKYGIDKASHPGIDIRNLTEPQAREIYFQEWTACGAESLEAGFGECYFNACVNCGVGRANKLMAKSRDAATFLAAQDSFYRALAASRPTLAKFLRGWLNRTADLRKFLSL